MTERSSDWRSTLCAVSASILIVAALLFLRPPGEPGVALRDFEAYYAAGATWLAHGDPYSLAIWKSESQIPGVAAARYEVLPFVGLPATLPFWSLFSRMPYTLATFAWSFLLICALISIIVATGRLLRLAPKHSILTGILALAFVPITSDFGLGQAALPAYAFAIFALTTPASLACIAVALSSLQPNVALGLLTMLESKRTGFALAGGAAIVYITGAFASGLLWPIRYIATLSAHANAERFAVIQYTPAAVLYGFGMPPAIAQLFGTLIAIVALLFAVGGVLRAKETAHRFAILCCAVPFVAGFFHEHDFVALFVPVIFTLTSTRNAPLAVIATVLAGINWLDFAQQPQGLTQDAVLAAALMVAAIGFSPRRDQVIAVAASVTAVALGAWIGQNHPLPIWPNDMPAAASGATIAEVWKNEQLQTGLLRPDAAAAVLRSFALLGSALLFYLTLDVDVHHVVERRDAVGMEVL